MSLSLSARPLVPDMLWCLLLLRRVWCDLRREPWQSWAAVHPRGGVTTISPAYRLWETLAGALSARCQASEDRRRALSFFALLRFSLALLNVVPPASFFLLVQRALLFLSPGLCVIGPQSASQCLDALHHSSVVMGYVELLR